MIAFVLDLLLATLLVVGASLALIGSLGLLRLTDVFQRMHAPTKSTTLGLGCVLIVSALWFSLREGTPSLHEFLITVFLFVTAPVSAQMLAKAALHMRQGDRHGMDDPPR